jgi:hypothetical protein
MKTSRRRVVLALGSTVLVPLMGADAFAQTPSRADRAFEALGRRWLDRSMRLTSERNRHRRSPLRSRDR